MRAVRILTIAAVAAGLLAVPLGRAEAEPRIENPLVLRSYDGTPIVATLMLPAGASAEHPVPAILETHGWGGTRRTSPGGIPGRLLDQGYAILTWDSRGFGDSGGVAGPGGPPEVADASMLIDYLASRPEIRLDGPGDPRVGWVGGSNAGGVQINTAAADHRIDAIAPEISWGDLTRDLLPNGAPKTAWAELLYAAGLATATALGIDSPAGTQLGGFPTELHVAEVEGLVLQQMGPETAAWFAERSTTNHSSAVTTPTLLVQGSIDTLFPLEEAFDNYANLLAAGTPVKLVTYCSGHSLRGCRYGHDNARDVITDEPVAADRIVAWMQRWVGGDPSVDTGPPVEWQSQLGRYAGAASYPLPGMEWVTGPTTETGTLVGPGLTGGDGLANAAPASDLELGLTAVRIPALAATDTVRDILGVPVVRLTGDAVGLTAQVHLELVDVDPTGGRMTVDDQVMPYRFAGHIDQDVALHGVAWRLLPGHSLEIELTTGSLSYAFPLTGPYTVDLDVTPKLPVAPK